MKMELLKKIGIYAGIILLLAGIAYCFAPEALDGKIINQSDIAGWKGMAQEAIEHNKANPDDRTAWTGSMFGGMPTTAIIDIFEGDWTKPLYTLSMKGTRPGNYLFITLLGAFLLMLSMGMSKITAVAGAIAVAFCSYNMQIIQVGHNTKMQAIAFFAWVLAGVIFTYRAALENKSADRNWKTWLPKTILGAVLFALALSMQIKANHIQITYYLAIVIFVYAIAVFINLCMHHKDLIKRFFITSALLLVVGGLGIATNANKLIPTYEYTPYTMRGGSELTADSEGHNNKGLDLEYATAWSYGINEMPNLLIPNFNGGASSGALDMDSETAKLLKRAGQPNVRQTIKHLPLYWGPQPFTAGPMYMGAITIFLFVLGLILLKRREKVWVIIATLIAIMLAWGNHFMWFTKLWFDYAPFYNKFRTVSMALVILQVTLPLLGFYVLDRILKEKYEKKTMMKAMYISYGITAGFCALCAIIPGIAGTFVGASDAGMNEMIVDALAADRQTLLVKDALRSLVLISCVFLLIVWAYKTPKTDAVGKDGSFVLKGRTVIVAVAMIFLVWFDMFSVGKRYLNEDHFITPKNFQAQYEPRYVDEILFEDEDPNYRVLDISINTFNSSISSYYHKTIGGYSPVKLQRYQDLIDRYITAEIRKVYDVVGKSATIQEIEDNLPHLKVVSMMNGKYIVLDAEYPPVANRHTMGNCWFVDEFVPAETPDDEIALIATTDLSKTAIIGKDFEAVQKAFPSAAETSSDAIALTYYAPNELRYSFNTESDRAVVFSEVFYPKGWKAWIKQEGKDAEPVELFRADWILRGAVIPQGEGELVMRFEPDSYNTGANISRACSITLLLLLLLSVGGMIAVSRKESDLE